MTRFSNIGPLMQIYDKSIIPDNNNNGYYAVEM